MRQRKPVSNPIVIRRKSRKPKGVHSFEDWVSENFKEAVIMQGNSLNELSILSSVTVSWLMLFEIPEEEAIEVEKETQEYFREDPIWGSIDTLRFTNVFLKLEEVYKKSLACVLYKRNLSHIRHLPAIKNIEVTLKVDEESLKNILN